MSDDLVTRLRKHHYRKEYHGPDDWQGCDICTERREAADRIDQLEAAIRQHRNRLSEGLTWVAGEHNDRLWAHVEGTDHE